MRNPAAAYIKKFSRLTFVNYNNYAMLLLAVALIFPVKRVNYQKQAFDCEKVYKVYVLALVGEKR